MMAASAPDSGVIEQNGHTIGRGSAMGLRILLSSIAPLSEELHGHAEPRLVKQETDGHFALRE